MNRQTPTPQPAIQCFVSWVADEACRCECDSGGRRRVRVRCVRACVRPTVRRAASRRSVSVLTSSLLTAPVASLPSVITVSCSTLLVIQVKSSKSLLFVCNYVICVVLWWSVLIIKWIYITLVCDFKLYMIYILWHRDFNNCRKKS